jgi:short-subunit dehydrogenase
MQSSMSKMREKRVFITGASSGIGAALAQELHRRGAFVGLIARRADRLQELAKVLEPEGGGRVAWEAVDVTDGPALRESLERLEEALGGVDVVIANAGYGRPEPPHRFRPGNSLQMYDTNLFGMLRLIDWVLPRFLERRGGHVVGVASVASYMGLTNSASYCGSKAAMRVHLQALRLSLRRYGIAVTTLCPGFVESELTAKARYRMPFLWDTPRAARRIVGAIERRRSEVIFPWQMKLLVWFITRAVPRSMVEYLLGHYSPRPQDQEPFDSHRAMA